MKKAKRFSRIEKLVIVLQVLASGDTIEEACKGKASSTSFYRWFKEIESMDHEQLATIIGNIPREYVGLIVSLIGKIICNYSRGCNV
ncbi:MAG: hypothetical protein ACLFSQ_08195 [Candidatus Zixiibacteriota bacterium]